jgi:hypothetical protein
MLALGAAAAWGGRAEAGYRHYYSSWHATPYHYYYRNYYYQPNAHDYVIYYPKYPRYLYYYNPVNKTYWGRFDVKTKGYSLLAEEDRRGALKDIPEKAFPEAGELPPVHGDKDAEKVQAPPTDDLPTDLPPGEDVAAKNETKPDTKTETKTETKADGDEKTNATPPAKPVPDDGGTTPTPPPAKPVPSEGTAAPAARPAPASPPATGPVPADDAPAGLKLPPGQGGCEKSYPKK